MKKILSALLAMSMMLSLAACGGSGSTSTPAASSGAASSGAASSTPAVETWTPEKTISVVCLSSAGGGSDINSRAMIETMGKIGVDADFIVDYQNEGGGAVGWAGVAETKNDDYVLMCYGFGDVINQAKSQTGYGAADYKAVATVAAEQNLLLSTPECKYANFNEAVEAAKNGTVVSIGGGGGVDVMAHQKVLAATGLTEDQMPYIQHNSTGDAIVTMLGNHCDYVISKPSACISYVDAGELIPYVAFHTERLPAPLDSALTMEELGYENVDAAMWRGFVVPKATSDAAYNYYLDIFSQLLESDAWMTDYIEKYSASPVFLLGEDAQAYFEKTEAEYIASMG